jgi:CheY-like chemotaxis protein
VAEQRAGRRLRHGAGDGQRRDCRSDGAGLLVLGVRLRLDGSEVVRRFDRSGVRRTRDERLCHDGAERFDDGQPAFFQGGWHVANPIKQVYAWHMPHLESVQLLAGPYDPTMSCVLVADDERDIRALARLLLELAGHRVVEASNGDAVFEVLDRDGDVDVVLLDLRLPGRDGWQVMADLQASGRLDRLRVVVFSAQLDPRDCARAVREGAAGYLAKPFDEDDLLAAIAS